MPGDGRLERHNNDDEEFGRARLKKLIVQPQQKSAPKILEVIYQTIFAFDNIEASRVRDGVESSHHRHDSTAQTYSVSKKRLILGGRKGYVSNGL